LKYADQTKGSAAILDTAKLVCSVKKLENHWIEGTSIFSMSKLACAPLPNTLPVFYLTKFTRYCYVATSCSVWCWMCDSPWIGVHED